MMRRGDTRPEWYMVPPPLRRMYDGGGEQWVNKIMEGTMGRM